MAKYYCGICKFFDDDDKKYIWHCAQCGLCRVSTVSPTLGGSPMEHCTICNACMPKSHTEHTNNMLQSNCPICSENLFTSTKTSFLPDPCRHAIHSNCYKDYVRRGNFACPICSRTYKDLIEPMKESWRHLATTIEGIPMPEEYKEWTVEFLCNDCNQKETAAWHFLGQQCSKCLGFNTTISATFRPDGSLETQAVSLGAPVEGSNSQTEEDSRTESDDHDNSKC